MADSGLQARAGIGALEPRERLELLVAQLVEAVTFDVREFWRENGEFAAPKDIPRPLSLLMKGVKMHRLAPVEHMDLLGLPACEVTELRWTSQADLLLRAIEVMKSILDRNRREGDPLSDEQVEEGALAFVAARRPDLAEKYPEVFGRKKP